jgi:hypothetical protein
MDHVLTAWIWVQFASCAFLTGLIWLVQRVHYPLLAVVGDKEFVAYEREHVRRITPVVAPMMLLELVAALCLVVLSPPGVLAFLSVAGLLVLGLVWGSTWILQVPAHRILEHGRDPAVIAGLVRSNWIRTVGWSLRFFIAASMLILSAGVSE